MIKTRRPFTVLLVEDDDDDTLLFELALATTHPSGKLLRLTNGEELLTWLNHLSNKEDVLAFLDVNMPRMNGLQALYHIRRNPISSQWPVFMWTASESPTNIKLAYEQEVNGYLFKQTSSRDFVRHLKRAIDYAFGGLTHR